MKEEKIRKFAYNQADKEQTDRLWILEGAGQLENLQTRRQAKNFQAFQTLRPPFSRWSRDRESSRANNL